MPSDPRASVKIIDGRRPSTTVAKPPSGGLFGCLFVFALLGGFGLSIVGSAWAMAWLLTHWPS